MTAPLNGCCSSATAVPQNVESAPNHDLREGLVSTSSTWAGLYFPVASSQILAAGWIKVPPDPAVGDPPLIVAYSFGSIAGTNGVSLPTITIEFNTTSSLAPDLWALVLRTTSGDLLLSRITMVA